MLSIIKLNSFFAEIVWSVFKLYYFPILTLATELVASDF